ncbi:hypothetical protein GCM10017781_07820 [Deinococcus metalli]|uniref:Uncharacterized protein n=1 Tax=Deinococcus metalli TaxID=1141878 RepID=A0ABQ3JLP6_9DEIO|nr:hypothetical protein GCM10017781_07820 [Deinococcus metalli]
MTADQDVEWGHTQEVHPSGCTVERGASFKEKGEMPQHDAECRQATHGIKLRKALRSRAFADGSGGRARACPREKSLAHGVTVDEVVASYFLTSGTVTGCNLLRLS